MTRGGFVQNPKVVLNWIFFNACDTTQRAVSEYQRIFSIGAIEPLVTKILAV